MTAVHLLLLLVVAESVSGQHTTEFGSPPRPVRVAADAMHLLERIAADVSSLSRQFQQLRDDVRQEAQEIRQEVQEIRLDFGRNLQEVRDTVNDVQRVVEDELGAQSHQLQVVADEVRQLRDEANDACSRSSRSENDESAVVGNMSIALSQLTQNLLDVAGEMSQRIEEIGVNVFKEVRDVKNEVTAKSVPMLNETSAVMQRLMDDFSVSMTSSLTQDLSQEAEKTRVIVGELRQQNNNSYETLRSLIESSLVDRLSELHGSLQGEWLDKFDQLQQQLDLVVKNVSTFSVEMLTVRERRMHDALARSFSEDLNATSSLVLKVLEDGFMAKVEEELVHVTQSMHLVQYSIIANLSQGIDSSVEDMKVEVREHLVQLQDQCRHSNATFGQTIDVMTREFGLLTETISAQNQQRLDVVVDNFTSGLSAVQDLLITTRNQIDYAIRNHTVQDASRASGEDQCAKMLLMNLTDRIQSTTDETNGLLKDLVNTTSQALSISEHTREFLISNVTTALRNAQDSVQLLVETLQQQQQSHENQGTILGDILNNSIEVRQLAERISRASEHQQTLIERFSSSLQLQLAASVVANITERFRDELSIVTGGCQQMKLTMVNVSRELTNVHGSCLTTGFVLTNMTEANLQHLQMEQAQHLQMEQEQTNAIMNNTNRAIGTLRQTILEIPFYQQFEQLQNITQDLSDVRDVVSTFSGLPRDLTVLGQTVLSALQTLQQNIFDDSTTIRNDLMTSQRQVGDSIIGNVSHQLQQTVVNGVGRQLVSVGDSLTTLNNRLMTIVSNNTQQLTSVQNALIAGLQQFGLPNRITSEAPRTVADPTVRLSGGRMGRLEVLHDGQWGTVCDDGFNNVAAQVVCRSLGFGFIGRAQEGPTHGYGHGVGQIWLDDVSCMGTEDRLAACTHRSWGLNDCSHGEDVGVVCQ